MLGEQLTVTRPIEDRDSALESPALSRGAEADGITGALPVTQGPPRWLEWNAGRPLGATGSSGLVNYVPGATALEATRTRSRGFLIALASITLIPLIGMPLSFMIADYMRTGLFPGSLALLAITGPMHVAATSFFYFDHEFRSVMRESAMRCLWSPIWLPLLILGIGVSLAAVVGGWAFLLVFSFHNTWLFYHYQRQNFGLLSFISTNFGCGRLPPQVNTALNLAALGAIISMLGTPGFCPNAESLVSAQTFLIMWSAGLAVYVLSAGMMIWLLVREPNLRGNAWLFGGLILGIVFFLPAFLFRTPAVAFLPYAVAHGAQYILMMSVLTGRSSRGWIAFLTMCGLGATIGLTIDSMRAWPAILAYIGIVEVHFLIDAKVWRLREPQQRAIMNRRFDFLLAR